MYRGHRALVTDDGGVEIQRFGRSAGVLSGHRRVFRGGSYLVLGREDRMKSFEPPELSGRYKACLDTCENQQPFAAFDAKVSAADFLSIFIRKGDCSTRSKAAINPHKPDRTTATRSTSKTQRRRAAPGVAGMAFRHAFCDLQRRQIRSPNHSLQNEVWQRRHRRSWGTSLRARVGAVVSCSSDVVIAM